ncbi:MAG: alpha/beta hydrolase [Planctomycetota bacterium]
MPYYRHVVFALLATVLSVTPGCGSRSSPKMPHGAAETTTAANDDGSVVTDPKQQIAQHPPVPLETPDLTIPNLTEPSPGEDLPADTADRERTSADATDASQVDGFPTEHSAGDVVEFSPDRKTNHENQIAIVPQTAPTLDESVAPPSPSIRTPAEAPDTSHRQHPVAESSSHDATAEIVRREGLTKNHQGFSTEHVFFATNRDPAESAAMAHDPDLFFGDERGNLSYGTCEVSIPYRRTPGSLPEPSILKLEFSQDPAKHIVLLEIERLPDAAFWKALRAKVEESPNRQLMLFVHGYCATFRDAARRTAQMAYDMNYQGPSMFFSWPAGSDVEGFSERANYLKDLRRAEESDEDLIHVLEELSRLSGAQRIHLVAHSMGNFVLTEALKTIDDRMNRSVARPLLFDQVAMAAPDLNARDFVEASGRRVRSFSRRFTVYVSRNDKALKLSKTVNGFEPLGLLNSFSKQGAAMSLYELVDASPAQSGWFDSGHVYYGDMPAMLRDLAFVFQGTPATSLQRGLGETPPVFRLSTNAREVQ